MSARDRSKYQDEDSEDRAGRQRVAEKGERVIPARKPLRHDPRADDRRKQKCSPERFRDGALCRRGHQVGSLATASVTRPISFNFVCSDSLSRLRIGNAVKILMRLK